MELVTRTSRGLLPTGDWQLDAGQSRIAFTIAKLGLGSVHGRFLEASAEISLRHGQTGAYGSVQVASVNTGNADRDAYLRDALFAGAGFPEMTFSAYAVEPLVDSWMITGALTIHGVTREVELRANHQTSLSSKRRRLSVVGKIDRRDFGLVLSKPIEAAGVLSPTVHLELELEFEEQSS